MKRISLIIAMTLICLMAAAQSGICDLSRIEDMNHRNKNIGRYYALIISIERYQDSKIPGLNKVSACARSLASVLKTRYAFSTDMVSGKKATKDSIEKKINGLKDSVGKNDTVLIYFAGRGEVDITGARSWWYPVDAKSGIYESYIDCEMVQSAIRNMKAKDVLLIADSGYADSFFGSVHRLPKSVDGKYYTMLFNKRSRWAMTSGNDYPDKGKGGRGCSTFSGEIVNALETNNDPHISVLQLYEKFRKKIRKKAFRIPLCRSLQNTGDRGGELIFVLKESAIPKAEAVAENSQHPSRKPSGKKPAPPEKRIGDSHIVISSNIKGATVTVDGVKIGKTPVHKYVIQAGPHKVEIAKDGYNTFSKNVIVKRGATVPVTGTLEKKKAVTKTGTLRIKAEPAGSQISFVGSRLKYSDGMSLDKGSYKVEVSSRFYDTATMEIDINAGEENTFNVELKPVKFISLKNFGKFVLVNPGSFLMGSPEDERMRMSNENQHKVILTKRIYMHNKEVTVGQWRNFIQSTRYKTQAEAGAGAYILVDYNWEKDAEYSWGIPGFPQDDDHPVVAISWNDTQAYIKWLNRKAGSRMSFRLPTEAEWEYACRAGSTEAFTFGPCLSRAQANFDGNSKWGSCPVGKSSKGTVRTASYISNAWGINDMHGNVKEWCLDWFGNYSTGDVTDPDGPASGSTKVIRGGGWTDYIYNNRSAKRMNRNPDMSYSDTGFRLVLELK